MSDDALGSVKALLGELIMNAGIVERAYQLAPQCRTIDEIRSKLVREGYGSVDAHLQATSLRRDLKTRLQSQQ